MSLSWGLGGRALFLLQSTVHDDHASIFGQQGQDLFGTAHPLEEAWLLGDSFSAFVLCSTSAFMDGQRTGNVITWLDSIVRRKLVGSFAFFIAPGYRHWGRNKCLFSSLSRWAERWFTEDFQALQRRLSGMRISFHWGRATSDCHFSHILWCFFHSWHRGCFARLDSETLCCRAEPGRSLMRGDRRNFACGPGSFPPCWSWSCTRCTRVVQQLFGRRGRPLRLG